MLILTLVMLVVGMASGAWFTRRYPNPSRMQTFAAVASLVGGILMMARPSNHGTAWFYVGAIAAMIAMSFLFGRVRHRFA
jgi:hypothetical protein